jgi:(1->4)-alpha-D-glucan 1-alpha-D-glucosylmutase
VNPDPDYVDRLMTFVERILLPGTAARPNAFLRSAEEFIRKVAFFGAINSLAQTLIKLTAPGVPDIYQGQELWDFSLVDPDNRRRVDLGLRRRYLEEMDSREDDAEYCAEMLRSWKDGRVKMWVTTRALRLRNELPELFHSTSYAPLEATEKERHVVAYARMMGRRGVVTVVPRFSQTMLNGEERWPLGNLWGDAEIRLPQEMAGREFRNALTGERVRAGEAVGVREVLGRFPVGLLVME